MSTLNDHEKFVKGIREVVREALAEKEEANRQQAVEQLLEDSNNTAKSLKDAVEAKQAELANALEAQEELITKVKELEQRAAELQQKLEDNSKVTEELKERASKAEGELAEIAAARRLEVRMADLEAAKVASSVEENRKAQAERVRGMSDEEFAFYKQELVDIRASLELELMKPTTELAAEETVEITEVIPADLSVARKEQAAQSAAATLNIEVVSEDLMSKYVRFGKALAANIGSRE